VGINPDFETLARKVKDYAGTQLMIEDVSEIVLQIEKVCVQACVELQEEFNNIKKKQNGSGK